MTHSSETERVRAVYQQMAGGYDRMIATWERLLFEDGRRWVCSQARGDVLEIGVGTGRNLDAYPHDVHLIGIDLSPAMLDLARARALQMGCDVDLQLGDAQALSFASESFDTVVVTLTLCAVPDDRLAIHEIARVLRADGRLVWLEHVRSPVAPVRWVQRLLDPVLVRLEADHLLRDPLDHIRREPFTVERLERSRLGYIERGLARRQSDALTPRSESAPEPPAPKRDPRARTWAASRASHGLTHALRCGHSAQRAAARAART